MWANFNSMNIPHAFSPVADHVTLSLGVATVIPLVGQPLFDLIRCADEFLYAAKRNGRNQIKSGL
jgi:PleD family two-component response regulator